MHRHEPDVQQGIRQLLTVSEWKIGNKTEAFKNIDPLFFIAECNLEGAEPC